MLRRAAIEAHLVCEGAFRPGQGTIEAQAADGGVRDEGDGWHRGVEHTRKCHLFPIFYVSLENAGESQPIRLPFAYVAMNPD
jgi:hypothetical protein